MKESVATAVVAEVVPPSTPAINEPLQVDSDAVTVEASPETVDEIPVSTDTTPTQQVEPEVSNSIEAAAVEVETAPSEIPTEVVDPAAQGDNSPSNTPEQNVTAEETAIALTPSKTETITSLLMLRRRKRNLFLTLPQRRMSRLQRTYQRQQRKHMRLLYRLWRSRVQCRILLKTNQVEEVRRWMPCIETRTTSLMITAAMMKI